MWPAQEDITGDVYRENRSQSKMLSPVPIAVTIMFIIAGFITEHAVATTYTYADSVRTDAFQWRESSIVVGLRGGSVGVEGIGLLATLRIESYVPHPGFRVHGSASGVAPGTVYLTHAPVSNYRSRCMWYVPGGGGTAEVDLTCKYQK